MHCHGEENDWKTLKIDQLIEYFRRDTGCADFERFPASGSHRTLEAMSTERSCTAAITGN
jgi:hypothetical protein